MVPRHYNGSLIYGNEIWDFNYFTGGKTAPRGKSHFIK
jgi:hypothetical protein